MDSLGEAFMEKHFPWRLKNRSRPHDFKPVGGELCEGGCKGGCVCDDCWLPKSNRIHIKIAKKEAERARAHVG